MSDKILDVRQMTMDFGGLRALDHVDLDVAAGEIVALIGPNGAGKTTFFNCITGIYTPTAGDVIISPAGKAPERINGLKPNLVTARGMARTFQNIRLYKNMTVLENVMIGRHCRTRTGVIGAIFRGPRTRREEQEIVDDSYDILKKIGLEQHVNELACNLPYGEQRRLEIARAMATHPFLIMLDEPAAGMNPQETRDLTDLINRIRDEEGISLLLIEHDMKLVMKLSERIFVLDYGKKIAEGTPEEIKNNPVVIKAYLGEDADA
ncbi:ABC transporter ATP-binding protein [Desulfonema ishimotonii]|uniref:ABC transporter ATP-binding protein n=1 Tax=Desulfonema ishimotonii TaxID=45657 RepID=A0A401G3A4_9BACT|nr:ABC transporter ATP-binding protein [Desulfonema ishimotonii]GBC63673.1 ABC transporter ATP-binding protein [Desulfonema ishimotonii]